MKNYIDNQRHSENGFTLVELLVVILIIGVLAAIAIPAFLNQRKAANSAAVESDLKNAAIEFETSNITNYGKAAVSPQGTLGSINLQSLATINILKATGFAAPDFHTSDGVVIEVLAYNADGSYCLKGTHPNSYYDGTTVATWDSEAGGLNTQGGACPASLVVSPPDAPVAEDVAPDVVDTVAMGGTAMFTNNAVKSKAYWQADPQVSFTDPALSEAELRAVAESVTLSGWRNVDPNPGTLTPANVTVNGNTATATFQVKGVNRSLSSSTYIKYFAAAYTDADGTAKNHNLWFDTSSFSPTAGTASTLKLWSSDSAETLPVGVRWSRGPIVG